MSRLLEQKIDELFESTKGLMSFDELEPYCEQFNDWLKQNTKYSLNSLGTVLSRHGFYKKFKSIKLEQGKNGVSIPKHDLNGNIKGYELRHYVVSRCGLSKEEWDNRNTSNRAIARLENGQEILPKPYFEAISKLLNSKDPHELAVGLIGATGRRPHEILARAKFSGIEGEEYKVMFEGQGKKRGEKPVFAIATLFPGSYVIEKLRQLRNEESTKELLKRVRGQFPREIAQQNRALDSCRNGSLNSVVRQVFGDKDDKTPILAIRQGDEQDNCKALRAAYACLATERDCKGSIGEKLLFAARQLGHVVKESLTDQDLSHLATTVGYGDYYVTEPVPFPSVLKRVKSKVCNLKVSEEDFQVIRKLESEWELDSQRAVVHKLLEMAAEAVELKHKCLRLEELEEEVKKLTQENQRLCDENHSLIIENKKLAAQIKNIGKQMDKSGEVEDIESKIERIIEEKLSKMMQNNKVVSQHRESSITSSQSQATKVKPNKVEQDWESVPSEELRKSKARGAVEEKLRRSYLAIANHNDHKARDNSGQPDMSKMWAITNQALRQLSGCNGQLVKAWMENHRIAIDDHHNKYGLGQYHNKGKGDITQAISW